ncbi:Protein kinase-like domain protein [Ophiocordyceps camponoti-floridani]|uniref:Protein kinase-like domain protein n=1 Tax=Ophiocordyceps camponoti-floridani TaxID=2030778 RepID=A0A8H4VEH5_9HYPO|nr:Protein kinase-like domain protein [Ophiocordyceps camponoti-floridani]
MDPNITIEQIILAFQPKRRKTREEIERPGWLLHLKDSAIKSISDVVCYVCIDPEDGNWHSEFISGLDEDEEWTMPVWRRFGIHVEKLIRKARRQIRLFKQSPWTPDMMDARERIHTAKDRVAEAKRCIVEIKMCINEWNKECIQIEKDRKEYIEKVKYDFLNRSEEDEASIQELLELSRRNKIANERARGLHRWKLGDFLRAHHHTMYARISIDADEDMDPRPADTYLLGNRSTLAPLRLEPWEGFYERQKVLLGRLLTTFGDRYLLLDSNRVLRKYAEELEDYPRWTDDDGETRELLDFFFKPVAEILNRFDLVDDIATTPDGGRYLYYPFGQLRNCRDDKTGRVLVTKEEDDKCWPDIDPKHWEEHGRQTYLYYVESKKSERDGTVIQETSVAGVCDFFPSHKLTPGMVRAGLHRPIQIYRLGTSDIGFIGEPVPSRSQEEYRYKKRATKWTLAALAPTYQYMLTRGISYGIVTTIEVFIFLYVDWSDPGTLRYHLAEPLAEAVAHGAFCSALAQLLSFSLEAYTDTCASGGARPYEERKRAVAQALPWEVDFETMMCRVGAEKRKPPLGAKSRHPEIGLDIDRQPITWEREESDEE